MSKYNFTTQDQASIKFSLKMQEGGGIDLCANGAKLAYISPRTGYFIFYANKSCELKELGLPANEQGEWAHE